MSHSYTKYYLTHLTILELYHLVQVGPETFEKNLVMYHGDFRQRRVHLKNPIPRDLISDLLCASVYIVSL